jgi:hypothetical protein
MRIAFNISHFSLILVAVAAFNGCTQVIETFPIETDGSPAPLCRSALGYYQLPRSLLNISAIANPAPNTPGTSPLAANPPTVTFTATTIPVADRRQGFCLDYLGLATSEDIVTVQRDNQGLLTSVSSNVTDKTPQIVQAFIQTGENLAIAAARDAKTAPTVDTLTMQFDPFLWQDLMTAKVALRRFGFCLYVEGFSFPASGLSPAALRDAADRWCSTEAGRTPPYENPLYTLATSPVSPEAMRTGILYRPKIAYKVVILRKADPNDHKPWTLYQTIRIEMVNASPVLSIGIDRAAFANRKTTVNFDYGTLTDVAVDKQSEAAGFVTIPLSIAQAIVDVPAQILQLRIADTQNQAALLQAQGQLFQAMAQYSQLVGQQSPGLPAGASLRSTSSGQVISNCLNGNGDPSYCYSLGAASQ